MKTIKEILENQEYVSNQIYDLIMDGKEAEVLEIISDLGYQIRTENQAPLDEKEGFDNEAHELAVFLQGIIKKVEEHADLSDYEQGMVIKSAKKAVKEITKDVMKTAEIRRSLSEFDIEKYRKGMQEGIEEAKAELEKTQSDYEFMIKIDEELFGKPSLIWDITTKDNQIASLDEIAKRLEEIKRIQENMSHFDPNNPEDIPNIDNHKAKIKELMSGIESRLEGLADGKLDITKLRDLIKNEAPGSDKIKTEINGKKAELQEQVTLDYKQIMENLKVVSQKYKAYKPFAKIDFSKMDPSTEEGRKAIENGYKPFKKIFLDIERRRNNATNNIENFTQEIELLDKEKTILSKDTTDTEAYREGMDEATKAEVARRKEEKHQDNRDKFYGNEAKAKQYREKFLKFKSHIKDAELSYIDKDGIRRTAQGKTIESYEGMEEDLDFLQLETYKDRLERVSLFRATNDLYAYNAKLAKKLDSARTPEERQAIKEEILAQIQKDADYIRTFHGAHNTTKMQYESYMNAGTALKAMVPLKTADTFLGKAKILGQNAVRYTGLKLPKFSRIDADGNRVSDIKSGLVTLGGDALIVGTTIVAPWAMLAAYAAKTGVVLGMRAYGKHYGKVHKDEMDIPTPYDGKAGARRAAREAFYLDEGHSRIGSWARAVIDNVYTSRRDRTESKIIEGRDKDIDISIDNQYILGAMASDETEKEKARMNQRIRARVHDQIRESGEVYNDVYRETDVARKKTTDLRINEGVALGLAGEDISDPSRLSFTDSKQARSTNFAKAKLSVAYKVRKALETNTRYGDRIGETVWTHSIQNEDINRAITRTTDFKRRIITVLTGVALKGIGSAIKDQVTKEVEVQEGTGEYERVAVGSHKEREIIGYNTTTTTRPAGIEDISIGDLNREGRASWGAFNNGDYYASGYHPDVDFTPGDNTVQGIAIKFQDVTTGRNITYSISGEDIGNIVHNNPNLNEFTQVYADGHLGITSDTKLSELMDFITDPGVKKAYNAYLSQYSGSEQVERMLDTVEFAWGRSESVIGKGWAPNSISPDKLREIIDTEINYDDPIFGDWKDVTDYELQEIMRTVAKTETITDPTLHALKEALSKAGLVTALQQLGEATAEVSRPTKERGVGGKPHVKLDKPEDVRGLFDER